MTTAKRNLATAVVWALGLTLPWISEPTWPTGTIVAYAAVWTGALAKTITLLREWRPC